MARLAPNRPPESNLGGRSVTGVGTLRDGWSRAVIVAWLPVAVVATVLAATSYAMTQQVTRSSADDAPRALAQRAADALSRGCEPAAVTPGAPVDLATDLGPFLMVFRSRSRSAVEIRPGPPCARYVGPTSNVGGRAVSLPSPYLRALCRAGWC